MTERLPTTIRAGFREQFAWYNRNNVLQHGGDGATGGPMAYTAGNQVVFENLVHMPGDILAGASDTYDLFSFSRGAVSTSQMGIALDTMLLVTGCQLMWGHGVTGRAAFYNNSGGVQNAAFSFHASAFGGGNELEPCTAVTIDLTLRAPSAALMANYIGHAAAPFLEVLMGDGIRTGNTPAGGNDPRTEMWVEIENNGAGTIFSGWFKTLVWGYLL